MDENFIYDFGLSRSIKVNSFSSTNEQKVKKCKKCDTTLPLGAKFCSNCGYLQEEVKNKSTSSNESDKKEEKIGITKYNDLYTKKTYFQAYEEEMMSEYSKLSEEEKERVYKKKAINPALGFLLIPIGIIIYDIIDCPGRTFIEFIKDLFTTDPIILLLITGISLVFTAPFIYLFIMFAIGYNKRLRHRLGVYDLKRDAKDVATQVALGVATTRAAKNTKDMVTKPLEPVEAHF